MHLEIDKGLVLNLPEENENYGIDNLKVVAAYAGRVAGKIRKYAKDGKLSLIEGIGVYRLTKNTIKAGRTIDYDAIRNEVRDLNAKELSELEEIALREHETACNELPEESFGHDIIYDFLDLGSAVVKFIKKRGDRKVA